MRHEVWRLAGGMAAGLLLVVGCAPESGENEPAPSTAPSSTSVTESAVPPAAQLNWSRAGTYPRGETPEVASRDYVGVTISQGATSGVAAELRRRDGTVVLRHASADGYYVQFMLLEDPYLVIVEMDEEHAGKPDRMTVYDLPSGNRRSVGGQVPDPWSGLWSIGDGMLTYGTHGPNDGYCLTEVDLDQMAAREVDCVSQGRGMSQAKRSPHGVGFRAFDHGPKPCPDLRLQRGGEPPESLDVTQDCVDAWDVLAVDEEAVLWSTVPDPHEVERAEFFVRTGTSAPESLGVGSNGSLAWCGDAAWFVRQMEGQLMRWTPEGGLEVALEISTEEKDGVIAVMSTVLCGGDAIAVVEGRAGPGVVEEVLHVAPVEPLT